MPQLSISKSLFLSYADLDKKLRKNVSDALDKFAATYHAGGHLEKPEAACDPRWRTLRINQGHRGVVLAPESGDLFLLVAVLTHDEAYRYVRSRRPSVNQALGVLEFRDEVALDTMGQALEPVAAAAGTSLFQGIPDKHFTQLGIDADTVRLARLLPDDSHLEALGPKLPTAQYDALTALASGMSPEEVWSQLSRDLVEEVDPGSVDPEDLAAAIRRSPDQAVFVEGPEELRELLRHPFDVWRTFLHPRQKRIAHKDRYSGPVMLTGGAGTGKTVTALHRVAHLADRYAPGEAETQPPPGGADRQQGQSQGQGRGSAPGQKEVPGQEQPILLTTFTTTLDKMLRSQLELLVQDPEPRRLVDVRNLDKVANQVVRKAHGSLDIQPPREAHTPVGATRRGAGRLGPVPDRGVGTRRPGPGSAHRTRLPEGSQARARAGQPSAGRRAEAGVWAATLAATAQMRERGQWTFTSVAAEAADLLERSGERLYRHVVVDESQDLHPAKWRLVRALVEEGPDDLFIAGDPHQRIYDHHVSMARVGINVRGRSHRLTVNYRSTQEILDWAVELLGTAPVEGFDGVRSTLQDYGSPLHGQRPTLLGHGSQEEEFAALSATVNRWLGEGVEPDSIGVTARTGSLAKAAVSALERAGVRTCPLPEATGVRVGTMHSMKGLEFRCVAVVGAGEEHLPLDSQVTDPSEDPVAHSHDLQRERNLLFVACTRARDSLAVSYDGRPSPFLPR